MSELPAYLVEFESGVAAERLARLAADRELVQTLQWLSFDRDTDEWKKLNLALVEYGYSVFKGWLMTGVVYQRAKARHVRGLTRIPSGLRLGDDDSHALAAELMVESVESFRGNVLAKNRWDGGRGATLKTFFVGHSLFQLPDVYERWQRDEHDEHADRDLVVARELERNSIRLDAGMMAVDAIYAQEVLESVGDEETKAMFELRAGGYSYDEIANMLDRSEPTVRTRLSRARATLRTEATRD